MPANEGQVICRFLCAIYLHIELADELNQGFLLMKYALNHPWKFASWYNAFFIGFCQMLMILSVEFVNMNMLLTNETILETLMNFLALNIISEFDDFLFNMIKNDPLS